MQADHGDLADNRTNSTNTLSEAQYKLPGDRAEMERLSIQHKMWTLLVGGLYPPSVKTIVEDRVLGKSEPTILDAGCGSASWPIEMAKLYPNAHVVGADLARNFQEDPLSNFEFIQMDLSGGLPASRDPAGYDLIHARSFHSHLKDPAAFIRHVDAALKPGGLFILGDLGFGVFGRDKVQLRTKFPSTERDPDIHTDGSWFAGWLQLWVHSILKISPGPLAVDAFLENSPFSVMFSKKYFCPVGWPGDDAENGAELGKIMLENTKRFIRASVPPVLASGKFSHEVLEFWIDAMEEEFKTQNLYLIWDLAVAVKNF